MDIKTSIQISLINSCPQGLLIKTQVLIQFQSTFTNSILEFSMEKSLLHSPSSKLPNSQQIIDKILTYTPSSSFASHAKPQPLIDKYTVQEITNILDRNKIQSIDKVYKSKQDGFNLLQFVRFFLNVIEHDEIQTLYLTIAIIDFFKQISQSSGHKQRLYFLDITNYICSRILNRRSEQNHIESKLIPDYRTVIPNFKMKSYLLCPPRIYSSKEELVYKLSINKIKIDKAKHEGVVTNSYFSPSLFKVFTLDDLSDSISVYNTNCTLVKKIKPHFSKLKKDIVVLSFAYSERQERIGAVLKDFSINFWDNSDNFEFEKSISTASHCQQCQTNIWFFEYFNAWVTSDKSGYLYVWDLQAELPQRRIKLFSDTQVNDLAVIPCINLLAVVQQRKIYIEAKSTGSKKRKVDRGESQEIIKKEGQKQSPVIYLYDFLKGQIATKIQLGPENRNPHTLQYSENYEVLLSAGYEKKISIFQINKAFLDSNKKGELTGHQSLITSFTVIKKSPMVISADDKGKVKIWDIRNYKCVQTLDFKDKTNITKLLDMIQLGKVGVLGSRVNFVEFDEKSEIQKRIQCKQKIIPLWVQCDYTNQQLILLTSKDLRIVDMKLGTVKNIFCQFHLQDTEITFFKYFESLQKFVIGNQKGQSKIYCLRTGRLEGKLIQHLGSITYIEYDQQNRIFITMGQDSAIQIQRPQLILNELEMTTNLPTQQIQRKSQFRSSHVTSSNQKSNSLTKDLKYREKLLTCRSRPSSTCRQLNNLNDRNLVLLRQMKNNFYGRQVTIGSVSIYHGFIVVASPSQKQIYIWDYQFSKLLLELHLPCNTEVSSLAFINGFSILMIGTTQGFVYFIRITKLQVSYQLKTIGIFQSQRDEPITHIVTDMLIKGFSVEKERFVYCNIYLGQSGGFITTIDLSKKIMQVKQEPSVVHKQSFNAERQLRQNFMGQIQKGKYQSYKISRQLDDPIFGQISSNSINKDGENLIHIYTYQAHRGNITGLNVIQLDESYLVSIGTDQRIKIWKQDVLVCDWNIKLPLPFKWGMEVKNEQKKRQKIMFAMKVIQEIFEKYGSEISINQSKCLKVRKLLEKIKSEVIAEGVCAQEQSRMGFITQPVSKKNEPEVEKPVLFQNQFTKKDMHYENIKKFNFSEISGPTLREIQVQKKLNIIQKEWSANKEKAEQEKNKLLIQIRAKAQKNQQKEQILQFMQPKNYYTSKNLSSSQQSFQTPYLKNLMNKIESVSGSKPSINQANLGEGSGISLVAKTIKDSLSFTNLLRQKSTQFKAKSLRNVDQYESKLCLSKKQNQEDISKGKYTFQKYYEQKNESNFGSSRTNAGKGNLKQNYDWFDLETAKKQSSFRRILNKMNSRVELSKKKRVKIEDIERGDDTNLRVFAIATSKGLRNKKKINIQ